MMITIHQPEHLVWLGLVDKIMQADVFVVLDTVQYRKGYFQNRNKIRTNSEKGWGWIGVPLKKHPLRTPIHDIQMLPNTKWKEKYKLYVESHYRHAQYFNTYKSDISKIIDGANDSLNELNISLIRFILSAFNVNTEVRLASSMNLDTALKGSDLILEINKNVHAKTYLSGPFGKDYLDQDSFSAAGIDLRFHEFIHPTYTQVYEPFIPGMSSIDLLFNHGPNAANILWPQ